MDRKEIEAQLRELPVESSVAFAIRVGLRALPWLAMSKDGQVLARWPDEDRARFLLAVFCAHDLGLLTVEGTLSPRLREIAYERRALADAAADAATDATSHSTAYAATDADAAVVAVAYAAASIAVGGDTAAAYAAYGIEYAGAILSEFKNVAYSDLEILRKNGVRELTQSPIWLDTIPVAWSDQLIRFQSAVRSLNSGFDIWLDWYAARCRGDGVDLKQLEQRVFLPESISSQAPQQINAYLTSLTTGIAAGPLNRVRTIFIGDGEAGKTSLIRVLNGEPVVEGIEAKTPGIAIREWNVPGTPIIASFWDFGGQVMVHATHQLFLRESCLYVLLVSAREKEKVTERAEYWLEHVKSFGKGAPVLIVANKADKEPVRLDESLLLEKYPGMIKGFFQLACTEARGTFRSQFEQFNIAFCQQLQAVGFHQVQFQQAHFAVLQNLRQRTPSQAFLTHQDYAALCAQHSVDAHGTLGSVWLLDILDKLGIIVHFPDMFEMEEYILNPRWLTYGVYTIMFNEQARMTRQQVVQLLASKVVQDQDGTQLSYPPGKCHIIFESMRRFKLCYFLPRDPDQLIIPALLPSDIKQHNFDTANALEFHYQFESFLPRHLISELIVECNEDIANKNGQDIVWQHGVLLHNKVHNIDALIKADYHFRRLSIWLVRGPTVAEFLAVLRDKVERIVSRLDIKFKQNIRLPHEARVDLGDLFQDTEWANFKLIIAQRNRGQTEYVSESETMYNIGKILGLFEPESRKQTDGKPVINIHIQNSIVRDINAVGEIDGSFNQSPK